MQPNWSSRTVTANRQRIHFVEAGPARSCCCATASRSPGTPGVTSSTRSPTPAIAPSRWTCAATAARPSPPAAHAYVITELVADCVGVVEALGESPRRHRRAQLGRDPRVDRCVDPSGCVPRRRRPERAFGGPRLRWACRGIRSARGGPPSSTASSPARGCSSTRSTSAPAAPERVIPSATSRRLVGSAPSTLLGLVPGSGRAGRGGFVPCPHEALPVLRQPRPVFPPGAGCATRCRRARPAPRLAHRRRTSTSTSGSSSARVPSVG